MIRRLRTLILITGMTLSVLIAAAFVVSAWRYVVLQVPTSYGPWVSLLGGSLTVILNNQMADLANIVPIKPNLVLWNKWYAGARIVVLPLYALFLAVAIPTLLVWRFGHKRVKPGHCACGYDLRGNVSGVCPECGRETEPTTGSSR